MRDWTGTTDQMIDRIRSRTRYDIALAVAAVSLSLAIVLAAYLLRPAYSGNYEFIQHGEGVYLGDRDTGAITFCRLDGAAMLCVKPDTMLDATIRGWSDE